MQRENISQCLNKRRSRVCHAHDIELFDGSGYLGEQENSTGTILGWTGIWYHGSTFSICLLTHRVSLLLLLNTSISTVVQSHPLQPNTVQRLVQYDRSDHRPFKVRPVHNLPNVTMSAQLLRAIIPRLAHPAIPRVGTQSRTTLLARPTTRLFIPTIVHPGLRTHSTVLARPLSYTMPRLGIRAHSTSPGSFGPSRQQQAHQQPQHLRPFLPMVIFRSFCRCCVWLTFWNTLF
jgi:hypothetical protein